MATRQEYAAVTAAVQAWVDANAGIYAAMIPAADIVALAKAAADALDAYRAKHDANSKQDKPS